MTLAAARRVGSAVAVTADWRLTHLFARPNYQNGALKVVILHPNVVCAYAGNASDALAAIRAHGEIDPALACGDFVPDLLATLQGASRDGKCDFLVAQTVPEVSIVRVKDSRLLRAQHGAQIGDHFAIEALLETESKRPDRSDLRALFNDDEFLADRVEAGDISSVLDELLRSNSIPTIGEQSILASNWPDGFRYTQTQSIVLTQDHLLGGTPGDQRLNQALRLIDGGALRVSVCPAGVAGVGALALHFPQHRLGLFTFPMRLDDEVVTYRETDESQLADRVSRDFGISLDVPPGLPK